MNSLDTRFSRNVFEAVQKTRSTCFIASKTTRLHLVVLNPDKTLLLVTSLAQGLDFIVVVNTYSSSAVVRAQRMFLQKPLQ